MNPKKKDRFFRMLTPEERPLFKRLFVLYKKWYTLKKMYALRRIMPEVDLIVEELEKLGWDYHDIFSITVGRFKYYH